MAGCGLCLLREDAPFPFGVPTPYNDAVMQLVARIERGECAPGIGNLAAAKQLAG